MRVEVLLRPCRVIEQDQAAARIQALQRSKAAKQEVEEKRKEQDQFLDLWDQKAAELHSSMPLTCTVLLGKTWIIRSH